jgi:hypothetical protein
MPKQLRYAIKQKLESVMVEMQKAADKTTEVGVIFKDEHPEYYDGFAAIVQGQLGLKEAVQNLSDAI